jgi:hypothetical protein
VREDGGVMRLVSRPAFLVRSARPTTPLGRALLPLTWVLLGAVLVVYVVGMLALAFAAVLVMTLRLLLTPPLTALGRAPGVRLLLARSGTGAPADA